MADCSLRIDLPRELTSDELEIVSGDFCTGFGGCTAFYIDLLHARAQFNCRTG
jgi:hypothetical protein